MYTKTKNYTDDGTVEIIKTPTEVTIRTYVGGNAYGAPLYTEKTKTIATGAIADKKYYLHRDYLGSIIAISDNTGAVIERRQFDAWGNLAKLQKNGVAITLPTNGTGVALMMLDRGYTSHEHLAEVGLIHMNGRLYDPVLRSFLMPDNFIQQPENTQNYNRYAYVLNNPLMYTDPSGEEAITFGVAVLIGAAIALTSYTLTALLADVPFSVGGLAKATFIGAASAAVTFGIGSAAGSLFTNFYSQAAFSAVAHGTFQGSMTAISGGKFWSGFAAGALSSIASSAWGGGTTETTGFSKENNWAYGAKTISHQGISGAIGANNTIGMIAFGTVSGGAGAALTGGNFWQGAITGLVVSGLNHAAHEMSDEENIDPNRFKRYFKSKLINSLDHYYDNFSEYIRQKSYNALRLTFNSAETVGGYMELGAVVSTLFTGGVAGPAAAVVGQSGFYISAFGTFGNAAMDYFLDNNIRGASYRVFKFAFFYGAGKALGNHIEGIDKPLLELHSKFYENVIVPKMENKIKL